MGPTEGDAVQLLTVPQGTVLVHQAIVLMFIIIGAWYLVLINPATQRRRFLLLIAGQAVLLTVVSYIVAFGWRYDLAAARTLGGDWTNWTEFPVFASAFASPVIFIARWRWIKRHPAQFWKEEWQSVVDKMLFLPRFVKLNSISPALGRIFLRFGDYRSYVTMDGQQAIYVPDPNPLFGWRRVQEGGLVRVTLLVRVLQERSNPR